MHIDNAIVELTRRCQLVCDHCLRGEAQKVDLQVGAWQPMFSEVEYIGCLTLTGGEPSLNPQAVRDLVDYLHMRRCIGTPLEIDYFYVVSNGKVVAKSMLKALKRLSHYTEQSDITNTFIVSDDQFHGVTYRVLDKYEQLKYDYPFIKMEENRTKLKNSHIISRGLAADNGLGSSDKESYGWQRYVDDERIKVEGEVYFTTNGDVLSDCNLAYADMIDNRLGNVYANTLSSIIIKHSTLESYGDAEVI